MPFLFLASISSYSREYSWTFLSTTLTLTLFFIKLKSSVSLVSFLAILEARLKPSGCYSAASSFAGASSISTSSVWLSRSWFAHSRVFFTCSVRFFIYDVVNCALKKSASIRFSLSVIWHSYSFCFKIGFTAEPLAPWENVWPCAFFRVLWIY